jgi:hypothetical protein
LIIDNTASCFGFLNTAIRSDGLSLNKFRNNRAPSHTRIYGSTILPAAGNRTPADIDPTMATIRMMSSWSKGLQLLYHFLYVVKSLLPEFFS